MSEHWTDRLSAYLDDDLSPDERAQCDAHLITCAECRAVLEELQTVLEHAQHDLEQMPATDLWPTIAARLEHPSIDAATRPALSERVLASGESSFGSAQDDPELVEGAEGRIVEFRQTRRFSFSITQLALAASLLIAVSAGLSWFIAKRPVSTHTVTEPVVMAENEPFAPASADVRPVNFADAAYDAAVTDLERILAEQRDRLDPRTVRVVERSLQAIDEAIRQSREALASDPNNPFLNSHLADARQRKLEMLRRAAMLTEGGN